MGTKLPRIHKNAGGAGEAGLTKGQARLEAKKERERKEGLMDGLLARMPGTASHKPNWYMRSTAGSGTRPRGSVSIGLSKSFSAKPYKTSATVLRDYPAVRSLSAPPPPEFADTAAAISQSTIPGWRKVELLQKVYSGRKGGDQGIESPPGLSALAKLPPKHRRALLEKEASPVRPVRQRKGRFKANLVQDLMPEAESPKSSSQESSEDPPGPQPLAPPAPVEVAAPVGLNLGDVLTGNLGPRGAAEAAEAKQDGSDEEDNLPLPSNKIVKPKVASRVETKRKSPPKKLLKDKILFREQEVKQIAQLFRDADVDDSGELNWEECSAITQSFNMKMDNVTFKRLDKGRNGFISMNELLRYFFPHVTAADLRRAINRWCVPENKSEEDEEDPDAGFWDRFEKKSISEMLQIFKMKTQDIAQLAVYNDDVIPDESVGMDFAALRSLVSERCVENASLEQIFKEADRDGDGRLSFPEFASVMEDTYLREGGQNRTRVKMFFS